MIGASGFMQAPKTIAATLDQESDPYMDGYIAFQSKAKNPHERGSSNWRVWEHGNLTAQAERDF